MKLKKSEINLLLIVAGVVIAALSWVWGATPLQEKTGTLEAENVSLKAQVDMYQAVNSNLENYKTEMEEMKKEIAEIGNSYPVNVTREDEIMFLSNMEDAYLNDIAVSSMQMDVATEIYTSEGGAAGEGGALVHLYQQPTKYNFRVTYDGLKELVAYIATNQNKKGIEEIALSFDSQTGNLSGSMQLSQYYMTGLDKEYQAIKIPTVRKGVDDVFHTVKSAGGVNASASPDVTTEESEETEEE